ncbi:MAG: energy transducer TonB [Acidobacteriia bacterium]|nr:energy transducer TonB [Terriglobia bacterium]
MRTLSSGFLSVVLCLAAAGTGFAQQSPANPDNSANGADLANSPCRVGHDADKFVRVEGGVTKGLLIHKVNPSYPTTARKAHIEGTVVLCASISKKGKIEDLTAASGPTELIPSSIKAVKKWRYRPYLLNGEPVEVETEIRVTYALNR